MNNITLFAFTTKIGISTRRPAIRSQDQEDYIEVCACSVDLCNSYVSSSGVSSTLRTYSAIPASILQKTTPSGPSSSYSSAPARGAQFNILFELVNIDIM